jgi:hypothetical protein
MDPFTAASASGTVTRTPLPDWPRIPTMRSFLITYTDGNTETVQAVGYRDIDGTWIEFVDGVPTQLLRVRAAHVSRIEATKS